MGRGLDRGAGVCVGAARVRTLRLRSRLCERDARLTEVKSASTPVRSRNSSLRLQRRCASGTFTNLSEEGTHFLRHLHQRPVAVSMALGY